MKDTGIHHLRMLHIISKMTFILFVPVWVYVDLISIMSDHKMVRTITLICRHIILFNIRPLFTSPIGLFLCRASFFGDAITLKMLMFAIILCLLLMVGSDESQETPKK